MSQEKEVLQGCITLGVDVKTADGILVKGDKVKMSADMEVEKVDTNYDPVHGYVIVPNKEASGKCTIAMPGKRVADVTSGAAFAVGALLMPDSAGKMVPAQGVAASGTVTIQDYSAIDAGDTVTVNGVALTAGGTDFTAATSNAATALSLAQAINAKVPGVKASVAPGGAVVTITALQPGTAGNAITLATSMDAGTEGIVSGAVFTGGKDFFATGFALEAASAADQVKSMLWF